MNTQQADPGLAPFGGLSGRILVTQQKKNHPRWLAHTTMLPGWLEEAHRRRSSIPALWMDCLWAWRLFRTSRNYAAVLTGSERPALLFAALQRCLRPAPVPHFLIECMWNLPPGGWRRRLRRWQFRFCLSALTRTVVWSRRQVRSYAQALHVSEDRFVCVPFHTTLFGRNYFLAHQPYIFGGGDSNRDYAPLMEAAAQVPWKVIISSRNRRQFRDMKVPANVEITTVEGEDFVQRMARAGIVVVPLRAGLLHSGGHQTYLNAMAMGKAVVVADDCGADEYIRDGITGKVVSPGDASALRDALLELIRNPDRIHSIGEAAKASIEQFSLESYIDRILSLVARTLVPPDGNPPQIHPRA